MYNDKKCIAIIFDPSYVIHRIDIPMGFILDIILQNKNGYIIYGGIDRLCYHVEEYGKIYKIPKEQMICICIPYRCSKGFTSLELTSQWLTKILSFNPDKVYVFRDNNTIGMTTNLIRSCIDRNINVIEYNNKGLNRCINSSTQIDISKYYRTKPGEIFISKN